MKSSVKPSAVPSPEGKKGAESLRLTTVLEGLAGILDNAAFGVALIDPPDILYQSAACEELLSAFAAAAGSNGHTKPVLNRIDAPHFPAQLRELIEAYRFDGGSLHTSLINELGSLLFVELRPFKISSATNGRAFGLALLLRRSDQKVVVNEPLLQAAYDLTLSEARICSLLANGVSVGRISKTLRIHPSTTRTHLKRVFKKTRSTRQAELVRFLMNTARIG